jgi:hypothetical protein
LLKLEEPLYGDDELAKDLEYISSKLKISRQELGQLVKLPPCEHTAYASQAKLYRKLKFVQGVAERMMGKKIKVYS